MTDIQTVTATLNVEIFVDCPNDECTAYIDILKEKETNDVDHDDDSFLLRQVWPTVTCDDFHCDEVTCSECQTTFNVKGLEW